MATQSEYFELIYRVFLRQHIDVRGAIGLLQNDVKTLFDGSALIGEASDMYWPVNPEDIEKAKERGLLLTEKGENWCVCVREFVAKIMVTGTDREEIQRMVVGIEKDFVIVRKVCEKTQEIQALKLVFLHGG